MIIFFIIEFKMFLSDGYNCRYFFNFIPIFAANSQYPIVHKRISTTSSVAAGDRVFCRSRKIFLSDYVPYHRSFIHRGNGNASNVIHNIKSSILCLRNVSNRKVRRCVRTHIHKHIAILNFKILYNNYDWKIACSYRIEQAMTIYKSRKNCLKSQNLIYKRLICAIDMHREAMKLVFTILSIYYVKYIYKIIFFFLLKIIRVIVIQI